MSGCMRVTDYRLLPVSLSILANRLPANSAVVFTILRFWPLGIVGTPSTLQAGLSHCGFLVELVRCLIVKLGYSRKDLVVKILDLFLFSLQFLKLKVRDLLERRDEEENKYGSALTFLTNTINIKL